MQNRSILHPHKHNHKFNRTQPSNAITKMHCKHCKEKAILFSFQNQTIALKHNIIFAKQRYLTCTQRTWHQEDSHSSNGRVYSRVHRCPISAAEITRPFCTWWNCCLACIVHNIILYTWFWPRYMFLFCFVVAWKVLLLDTFMIMIK